MEIQEKAEFNNDLAALISSSGWRYVVKPSIQKRCSDIEQRLAKNKRLSLEDIRELQAKHAILSEILDSPVRFFIGGAE